MGLDRDSSCSSLCVPWPHDLQRQLAVFVADAHERSAANGGVSARPPPFRPALPTPPHQRQLRSWATGESPCHDVTTVAGEVAGRPFRRTWPADSHRATTSGSGSKPFGQAMVLESSSMRTRRKNVGSRRGFPQLAPHHWGHVHLAYKGVVEREPKLVIADQFDRRNAPYHGGDGTAPAPRKRQSHDARPVRLRTPGRCGLAWRRVSRLGRARLSAFYGIVGAIRPSRPRC